MLDMRESGIDRDVRLETELRRRICSQVGFHTAPLVNAPSLPALHRVWDGIDTPPSDWSSEERELFMRVAQETLGECDIMHND